MPQYRKNWCNVEGNYVDNLPHLARIRIPCWTGQHNENLSLEMHGFADRIALMLPLYI
jgi:hypothetical protein